MRNILHSRKKALRIRLGNDGPALVEPMTVELKPNFKPVIAKTRRYSPEQRKYISIMVDKLEEYGYVKRNADAHWAAAPLLVPKPGTDKFRLTFDLRPVNAATVPTAWPMPHVDAEASDFAGSVSYAVIDFCSGYWQLPLHPDSQNYHSFILPTGTYSPTRTIQGATNSASNFQSKVEPCFAELRDNFKAWIDDFVLHAGTEKKLLKVIDRFLDIC